MTRLLLLVEGQSEEIFVKQTLARHLEGFGVFIEKPVLLWTKRMPDGGGHRGGVSSWRQIERSVRPLLHDSNAWVTSLLDYYGLPDDFPGQEDARALPDVRAKVAALESRFAEALDSRQFLPFLALHELEAWLFSQPETVAKHFGKPGMTVKLQGIVGAAGEPELIDNGERTHPKARIQQVCGLFGQHYKETSDGAVLLEKIGVATIRAACPHFDSWLKRLEALGTAA